MERIDDQFAELVYKHGRTFVINLSILFKVADFYSTANESVIKAAARFREDLSHLMGDNSELTVKTAEQSFFIEDLRVKSGTGDVESFGYLSALLEGKGIGSLVFSSSLSDDTLIGIIYAVHKSADLASLVAELEGSGLGGINIGATESALGADDIDMQDTGLLAKRAYGKAVAALIDMRKALAAGRQINVRRAKRAIQSIVDSMLKDMGHMLHLTAPRTEENYFLIHSVDVAIKSIAIGIRLGLDKFTLSRLGMTALLHDIGILAASEEEFKAGVGVILNERKVLGNHPVDGLKKLLMTRGLSEDSMLSMLVAFEHHVERGKAGYPRVSDTWEISPFSRIVHIADDMDNVLNGRMDGKKPTVGKILETMRQRGEMAYDLEILKLCPSLCG